MAKARKAAARRTKPSRPAKKRKTTRPASRAKTTRSRLRGAKKVATHKPRRSPRRPKGVVGTVTNAVTMIADSLQESRAMARKAGPSGGLSEG